MINSFRRGSGRGTGKRTGDGEADGSGGSCSAVRAAALFPLMASGERSEATTAAGASSSRIQQLSFSCAVVFAAVACRRQRLEAIPPTTAKSTAGGKKSTADAGVRLVGLQPQRRQNPPPPQAFG